MLVVDASILAPALADDGADGDAARQRLRGHRLLAPEVIDLEVLSVFRRLHAAGAIDERRARFARDDLRSIPIDRASHHPLLERCWELRGNLSVYDAAYVALAEASGVLLLTADRRLAQAPGPRCEIEVMPAE